MKITHIPKDKLIEIRYEEEERNEAIIEIDQFAEYFDVDMEELKQTG